MNPLDNLTVCVTNFKRPGYLARTLNSLVDAGIRRVSIASICGDSAVDEIIEKFKFGHDWLSFDVVKLPVDIGCNNTWMLAAYHSRTERIIVLHDDDNLKPAFAKAYTEIIAPALDRRDVGFATWRAELVFDDLTTAPTEFFSGPTRIMPAQQLMTKVLSRRNQLSLSPIISVFDRETLIHACKESEATLTHNDCLQHPGMLLGTELVVYMRHVKSAPNWLYVDEVLSQYGSHGGSGTIKAQQGGDETMKELFRGYDIARSQGEKSKPVPKPKIIFVSTEYEIPTEEEAMRVGAARASWNFHFNQFDVLHFPVRTSALRSAESVGDPDPVSFIKDIFDHGCRFAMPEDIVVLANIDVGLTTTAVERLIEGVARGKGVTCCPRRSLKPEPRRLYKHLANCKADGGFDVFGVTPMAWSSFRNTMPDMLNGREAWDTVFRVLAEEWATGQRQQRLSITPNAWNKTGAYTDHVCWHTPHMSKWQTERTTGAGQIHNRKLAREFFVARHFHAEVKQLS